jgi:hypothetical protein
MSETRTRWSAEQWRAVTAHAAPLIARGKAPLAAVMIAQRAVLPKHRRRDEESVQHSLAPSGAGAKYLEEARKLLPEPLPEAPKPERRKPAPRVKLDAGRNYARQPGSVIRWTAMEKARVARWIKQQRDAGDTRALSRLIIEAQEVVLDVDRRRPIASIQAGGAAGSEDRDGLNGRMYQEGLTKLWLLPAEPEVQAPTEETPATPETFQEAAQAEAAPTASPVRREGLSEAARAFGETVMDALDKLLAVHTDTLLTAVYAKLSAAAADTSAQIAAQIERGLRDTVHKIIEVELGPVGPSTAGEAPAPDPSLVQAPAPEEESPVKRLKVDVVGLHTGSMEQEVRQAINGHADLRFIPPEARGGFAPHKGRHCIVVTQRIPHALKHKIKAAGIEPIYVKSTPGHVIHAIEELHRASGLAMQD